MPAAAGQALLGLGVDLGEGDVACARRTPSRRRERTCRHGPHHSAQKSTRTMPSSGRSPRRCSSVSATVLMGPAFLGGPVSPVQASADPGHPRHRGPGVGGGGPAMARWAHVDGRPGGPGARGPGPEVAAPEVAAPEVADPRPGAPAGHDPAAADPVSSMTALAADLAAVSRRGALGRTRVRGARPLDGPVDRLPRRVAAERAAGGPLRPRVGGLRRRSLRRPAVGRVVRRDAVAVAGRRRLPERGVPRRRRVVRRRDGPEPPGAGDGPGLRDTRSSCRSPPCRCGWRSTVNASSSGESPCTCYVVGTVPSSVAGDSGDIDGVRVDLLCRMNQRTLSSVTQRTTQKLDQPGGGHLGAGLKPRHITMISIAGVIGAGLFIGSATAISKAGPAVLIAYALAGTLVVLVMRMLGEMATAHPDTGSFSTYADRALGRWAGFSIGWLYWWFWVIVIPVEATAGALILHNWVDAVPQWAFALAHHRPARRHQPVQRRQLRRVRVLVRAGQGHRDRGLHRASGCSPSWGSCPARTPPASAT